MSRHIGLIVPLVALLVAAAVAVVAAIGQAAVDNRGNNSGNNSHALAAEIAAHLRPEVAENVKIKTVRGRLHACAIQCSLLPAEPSPRKQKKCYDKRKPPKTTTTTTTSTTSTTTTSATTLEKFTTLATETTDLTMPSSDSSPITILEYDYIEDAKTTRPIFTMATETELPEVTKVTVPSTSTTAMPTTELTTTTTTTPPPPTTTTHIPTTTPEPTTIPVPSTVAIITEEPLRPTLPDLGETRSTARKLMTTIELFDTVFTTEDSLMTTTQPEEPTPPATNATTIASTFETTIDKEECEETGLPFVPCTPPPSPSPPPPTEEPAEPMWPTEEPFRLPGVFIDEPVDVGSGDDDCDDDDVEEHAEGMMVV